MTTPAVTPIVTTIQPTKAKAWVALATTVLTVLIPFVLEAIPYFSQPWPLIITAVVAAGGVLGVWKVPNTPADTSVVPNDQITTLPTGTGYTPVPDETILQRVNRANGGYVSTWK